MPCPLLICSLVSRFQRKTSAIAAGGSGPFAIAADGEGVDLGFVSLHHGHLFSGLRVPHAYRAVPTARDAASCHPVQASAVTQLSCPAKRMPVAATGAKAQTRKVYRRRWRSIGSEPRATTVNARQWPRVTDEANRLVPIVGVPARKHVPTEPVDSSLRAARMQGPSTAVCVGRNSTGLCVVRSHSGSRDRLPADTRSGRVGETPRHDVRFMLGPRSGGPSAGDVPQLQLCRSAARCRLRAARQKPTIRRKGETGDDALMPFPDRPFAQLRWA